jgi:hypothetical protein
MSTFFLNINDTIACCDTIVVKVATIAETCQPCLKEAETNWQDVAIVFLFCAAFVSVALIAKCTIKSWKEKEIQAKENEQTAKTMKDQEESKRKQKSDLLERYLNFLKDNASKDESWSQEYKQVLSSLIGEPSLSQKTDNNEEKKS